MNINDPKNAKNIQRVLKDGALTEFWQIMTQALNDSIEHLQQERDGQDIMELEAEQYKMTAELLKGKISFLRKLKEMPESLINYLDEPDQTQPDFDPYYKPEDFLPKESE